MLDMITGTFVIAGVVLLLGFLAVIIGAFGHTLTENNGGFDWESLSRDGARITFWTLLFLGIHDLICFPILLYFIYQLKL